MSADEPAAKSFSLKRWSKKKLEAARAAPEPAAAPAAMPVPPADAGATPPAMAGATGASAIQPAIAGATGASAIQPAIAGATGASATRPLVATPTGSSTTQPSVESASDTPALPPVESLTFDSDFAAFLQPKVDEALKRQALKQLFRDPRFNVMDGLDVYIDDYSKPDPISPDIVRQLVQGRYIFDPPATRVNERGEVEDVPPEEVAVARAGDEPPASTDAAPATATEVESATLTDAAPATSTEAEPATLPEAVPGASPDNAPAGQAEAALPAQRERPDSTDSTPR
jgi:hypothetical protein